MRSINMENDNDFYKREVNETDLASLVRDSEASKEAKEESAIAPDASRIFDFSLKDPQDGSFEEEYLNPGILETFLDYLESGCSFIRVYTYLRNMNEFLERNPDEIKRVVSRPRSSHISNMIKNQYFSYIKRLKSGEKKRKLDIGDRVKIDQVIPEISVEFWVHVYIIERDKLFPRGTIGSVIGSRNRGYDKKNDLYAIYFKNKKEGRIDIESIKKSLGVSYAEDISKMIAEYDPKNNIGLYLDKELIFVPPNELYLPRFMTEIERFGKIIGDEHQGY
jgi:hypothetical protein